MPKIEIKRAISKSSVLCVLITSYFPYARSFIPLVWSDRIHAHKYTDEKWPRDRVWSKTEVKKKKHKNRRRWRLLWRRRGNFERNKIVLRLRKRNEMKFVTHFRTRHEFQSEILFFFFLSFSSFRFDSVDVLYFLPSILHTFCFDHKTSSIWSIDRFVRVYRSGF